MNIFLQVLSRVIGRPVREELMSVSHDGRVPAHELSALANLTRRIFGPRIKFSRRAKPRKFITTTDLDLGTLKPYENYAERRKGEGAARVTILDLTNKFHKRGPTTSSPEKPHSPKMILSHEMEDPIREAEELPDERDEEDVANGEGYAGFSKRSVYPD